MQVIQVMITIQGGWKRTGIILWQLNEEITGLSKIYFPDK